MLRKMLLAADCVAGICGICEGMQLKSIDRIINAPFPLERRLAALGGVLVEDHKEIYTFEVTDKKNAEAIIDIFLEEGKKIRRKWQIKRSKFCRTFAEKS